MDHNYQIDLFFFTILSRDVGQCVHTSQYISSGSEGPLSKTLLVISFFYWTHGEAFIRSGAEEHCNSLKVSPVSLNFLQTLTHID